MSRSVVAADITHDLQLNMVVYQELLSRLALGLIPEQFCQQEAELDAPGVLDIGAQYADIDVEATTRLGNQR